eukprot:10767643-Prorocentrum_lima.AAC.1
MGLVSALEDASRRLVRMDRCKGRTTPRSVGTLGECLRSRGMGVRRRSGSASCMSLCCISDTATGGCLVGIHAVVEQSSTNGGLHLGTRPGCLPI